MREILLLLGVVLTAFSLAGAESLKVDATRRGFLIKSENADITTMTSVIVCVPPFREKHFYNVTDDIDLVNTGDRAAIIQAIRLFCRWLPILRTVIRPTWRTRFWSLRSIF